MSPVSNRWVNASSFMDRRFWLTILIFCGRDCLSFLEFEQWKRQCFVDSIALRQLQIRLSEFRNLWRSLCSRKSSQRKCSVKKGVLTNFAKFTGKHLCQSLHFNKVAGLIKKETLAQVFSCEFCEICKSIFFIEDFWWLHMFLWNTCGGYLCSRKRIKPTHSLVI